MVDIEPDFHRRDAIHSLVNDLPDASYSCTRALALHLNRYVHFKTLLTYRIAEHADENKMTVQNLANVLGPTLLASEDSSIEETRAQIRVVETIIAYANDMFELGISTSPAR
jgi:Rho GTPase-activating protein RGD1